MSTSPTPWRVGRKVFRTVYDATGRLIGMMDTAEDAARVVDAVNGQADLEAMLRYRTKQLQESCPHNAGRAVAGPGDEYCERCGRHNPGPPRA